MSSQHQPTDVPFVETTTVYDTDIDDHNAITIWFDGIDERTSTFFSQALSLFIETHSPKPLVRMASVFSEHEGTVLLSKNHRAGHGSSWPVELAVDGLSADDARNLMTHLRALAGDPTDENTIRWSGAQLAKATSDQPRSVVRMHKHDGSRRPSIEWHTDVDADLETPTDL